MRYVIPSLAALAVCTFGVAMAAQNEPSAPAGMERTQQWAADHEALFIAKLAGLKAGLKLTPEQEKLWAPFEGAVRDAAKLRMDQMQAMAERMQKMREMMGQTQNSTDTKNLGPTDQAISPVDRLDAFAQHMSDRAAALKKVADAAKPLYASLDDSQKRLFGLLGGNVVMLGHGHRGMGMMGGAGEGMGGMGMMGGTGMMGGEGMGMERMRGGMRGEGGMGMTGRGPGGMDMMGNWSSDDEETSDEE